MCERTGGWREVVCSETTSLLSYTLRYVSFGEVGSVWRVAWREPMYLCTCVSEEVGDREGAGEGGDLDLNSVLYLETKPICFIIWQLPEYCVFTTIFTTRFSVLHHWIIHFSSHVCLLLTVRLCTFTVQRFRMCTFSLRVHCSWKCLSIRAEVRWYVRAILEGGNPDSGRR
jgi:hypothetical protein